MNNIKGILQSAVIQLNECGIDNARLDAEILLANVLNVERIFLYVNFDCELNNHQLETFQKLIKRRAAHEPTAYIIGQKEFMGLNFVVTADVLIPRPETEILVEEVVERLKKVSDTINFADIGVGSGAICIAILKFLENSFAEAVDISPAAIEVAKINSTIQGVSNRINFYTGDLLTPLSGKKFNAIISNPPYIPNDVIKTLQPEVLEYEPHLALDGGEDGLNFYRRLINESPNLIADGGFLAVEIGINQAIEISTMIEDNGQFDKVEIIKDLAGIERVLIAHKK